ncbi:MAG: uroporphyrinogen-III synthase [Chloroflexi bacterium]|nr:uroporphyrinogen-III synthase [Chloroflexota bacterium]
MSILSTRPAGAADPLVAALGSAGHRVHAVPTVELKHVEPGGSLDLAVAGLTGYDWIIATSAAGAVAVLAAMDRAVGPGKVVARKPLWAAVGRATAVVLEEAGVRVDVVPEVSRGVAITQALLSATGSLADRRVLLPRSDRADGVLPDALRAAGATVDDVVAYRTVEGPPASVRVLLDALSDGELQAIVLCSGSAVRGLLALAASGDGTGATQVHSRIAATPLVSIGPSTSAAIREAGLQVAAEAARPSVDDLVVAVNRMTVGHRPPTTRTPQEVVS